MVSELAVAKKYAQALYINAKELDIADKVLLELKNLMIELDKSETIKNILFNKHIPKKVKSLFCNTAFNQKDISKITENFIRILLEKHRFYLFKIIIDNYEKILDDKNGVTKLKVVITGHESESNIKKVQRLLHEVFKTKKIKFDFVHDKNILGGIIVKKGSEMLDLSIKSRLSKIESIVKSI